MSTLSALNLKNASSAGNNIVLNSDGSTTVTTLAANILKNASSASNNITLNSDGTTTISAPSNIVKSGTSITTSATSTASTISGNTLTVGGTVSGSFQVGQTLTGTGVAANTQISSLVTGTGGAGTYLVSGAAQTVASTAINAGFLNVDFTGIPSWAKIITVMFDQISTNAGANYLVQVGAGSIVSTGYTSAGAMTGSAGAYTPSSATAGMIIVNGEASSTNLLSGVMTFTLFGSNTWIQASNLVGGSASSRVGTGSGRITLSGTLDRVRITSVSGTDLFDAGAINILYQG